MTIFQAVVLGLVQGATEFIPVSSSGHLLLVPWLFGWEPPGLAFTIVVHLGTVFGVVLFFWKDWVAMIRAGIRWLRTGEVNAETKLLGLILLGIIPAAVIGGLFRTFFESVFKQPIVAVLMLLVTALLLFLGERLGKLRRAVDDMTWRDSLFIGFAQALAILPGISRSGSTIAAARLRDLKRDDAARYSFLLSTPLIIGIGPIEITALIQDGSKIPDVGVLIVGFLVAFVSAYLIIRWLLKFLRMRSTNVFAWYCAAASLLGLVVFVMRAV